MAVYYYALRYVLQRLQLPPSTADDRSLSCRRTFHRTNMQIMQITRYHKFQYLTLIFMKLAACCHFAQTRSWFHRSSDGLPIYWLTHTV